MAWEKSSADLISLFHQVAPSGPNIQHKKMFGYPAAFVNGKLFAGLFRQSMVFRLSPRDQAAFLDHPGATPFEPMPGRKMTGFAVLLNPFEAPEEDLVNWMQCALQFASKLPAKNKNATKRKKS